MFRASLLVLALAVPIHADSFDLYLNRLLERLPREKAAEKVTSLSPLDLSDHDQVLPGVRGSMVVVKNREGRMAKLLIEPARQKVDKDRSVPIVVIQRFVTYREGEDKTILAQGKDVRLFPGFRFNLDIGQVVPEDFPADLKFVVEGDKVQLEPIEPAEMYLLTKHHPDARPEKREKVVVGDKLEPKHAAGTYKIYDDGRRSGTLTLRLVDQKTLLGHYYSDKDGAKYDVEGNIGSQNNLIHFTIVFPRTQQEYFGYLFTGDAKAITGYSRLQDRETGFYAIREE